MIRDDWPAGEVIEQTPASGQTVPAGSTVDLVVNLGKETVSVIDVTGMRPERAQSLLEAEGLTLGEVTELYHESQPAGIIFAQEPRPGTRVDKGSAVAVMVSKGPEKETPPEQTAQPPTEPGVEAGGEGAAGGRPARICGGESGASSQRPERARIPGARGGDGAGA